MATMPGERVFVDTNVLVHAAAASSPFHAQARLALESLHAAGAELWISRQVLREYLAVLSRPQTYSQAVSMEVLAQDARSFEGLFRIADETRGVTRALLDLVERVAVGGKQVHDTNIVATMISHGIQKLLTQNSSDFSRFSDHISLLSL